MRKLVTMMIYLWDLLVLGKKSDYLAGTAVGLITIGAVIAGFNDLTGDLFGFSFALIANLFTAAYLQLSSLVAERHKDINAVTQAYYNGLISMPVVIVLMLTFEEHVEIAVNPYSMRTSFILTILGVCVLSVANMLFSNLCTTINSPMATTVTGNMKVQRIQDVVTMSIGLVAFGDVVLTPLFLLGLLISTSGALIYSYSRLREAPRKRPKHPSEIIV